VHFCKDTSCNHILESDEEICPNSLDHAGWQEEGVLNAVLEKMKNIPGVNYASNVIKEIERAIQSQNKSKIIDVFLKYAPFELLTTGWGKRWSEEMGKFIWKKVKNDYTGELSYLIYRKD
jgi:hypothetical protein